MKFNGINNINGKEFGVLGNIGSLPVTIYGILVVTGFIVAVIVAAIKLKKFYKVSYDPLLTFAVIAFPLGVVFASIWSYAIGNSDSWYSGFTGTGGLAIQGGVTIATIFGCIFFPLYLKKARFWVNVPFGKMEEAMSLKRISTWVFFDAIVPVVLLGQAIGRWGNFFNYEVFGQKVSGMTFSEAQALITTNSPDLPMNWLRHAMPGVWYNMWIADGIENTGSFLNPSSDWANEATLRQPLFLYESFFNIVVFVILYGGLNFVPKYRAGIIGGLAIAYTGVFRSVTEPMRDSQVNAPSFRFEQSIVLSAILITIGLLIALYAFFVSGSQKMRHVAWFEFAFDWIKAKLYRFHFVKTVFVSYAGFQDNWLKTNLANKVYTEAKRLDHKEVLLTDYILDKKKLKYYGSNWIYFGAKRKIWIEG